MASGSSSTAMSFPEYTFDLSSKLRQAARSTLAELEASINRDGYDWLEDYLDNIQVQGRRAPIADLIKTPSRTATAKKTRSAMTATINRAEQVKQFNARLALSPLADKSPAVGRQPFSPLRANSVNSPSRLALPHPASPSKSPLGKVSKLQLKPKAKAEKKDKGKGKAKANKADAENIDDTEEKPKKRTRTKKTAVLDESTASKGPASAAATPRKAVRSAAPKAPSPEPEVVEPELVPEIVEPEPEPEPEAVEVAPEPIAVDDEPVEEEDIVVHDEPVEEHIMVDDEPLAEEAHEEPMDVEPETVAPDADTDIEESEQEDDDDIVAFSPAKAPTSPSPVKKAASPLKMSSPAKCKSSSPIKAVNPAAAPARQVRSSWLTQALGDRPVPVSTSNFGDSTRKSLATGSLKRKSEDGPGGDAEDKIENKRAEKTARFDSHATDAATGQPASPIRSTIFAARQPGSTTSLPAAASMATPGATSEAHQNPTSVPHDGRTKADKVSRALEELRERTAAAAAAKQKSAAANKLANATKAPIAPAAGGGFFRGLGNLGAGLFGLGALSAEDEEARVRRAAEDRRAQEQAEAELARIMNEMVDDKTAESPELEPKPVFKKATESKSVSKKATVITTTAKVVATSEGDSDQMGDVAIVVDDESEDGDDESDDADDSFNLPELPTPDFGDEYDDEPFEDGPTSALGAAGIQFNFDSTTPPHTPPLKVKRGPKVQTPQIIVSPPPKETKNTAYKKSNLGSAVRTNNSRPPTAFSDYDDDDNYDEDDAMDEDEPVRDSTKKATGRTTPGPSRIAKSGGSVLSQAERIAAKALGVKPATAPVASIQRAADAAKKEEATAKRQAALRAGIERRKQAEARRKEEAEREAAEDERKRKAADIEERRKRLVEAEKRRAEHMGRLAQLQKEKAAREEREATEARAKAAEEEAARKRKVAAMLSKSQQQGPGSVKRIAQPAGPPPGPPKPLRLSKSSNTLAASTSAAAGPSSAPTIKLVQSKAPGAQRTSNTASSYSSAAALQHSRLNLQAQLDNKVAAQESEDIVLPDIASEYSDSDDSDRETDFKRPAWAESPELKSALERQATLNPDELFGAIRPLNMDELFKQRQGKFRARTSSANWSGADRLTETEEREYARRMGFKAINAPRDGGGSAGDR